MAKAGPMGAHESEGNLILKTVVSVFVGEGADTGV